MSLLTPDDYLNFPVAEPDATYAYGKHPDQFGDLYLPSTTTPAPVIILIHGGCYRDKYNLKPVSGMARSFADAGFAVWNIEYRRAGNDGDYPTMFLDVASASDHLRIIAESHALDLNRVLTVGHSAGGHLALWVAGRHRIDADSPLYRENPLAIHGAVALAPIADLVLAFEQEQCKGALTVVMGGDPQTNPAHYVDGSPHALLPLGVRQVAIIGTEDDEMIDNTRPYITSAQSSADDAELVLIPDVGHFEIVDVTSDVWHIIYDTVTQWTW